MSSRVLYSKKINENKALELKARIASHRNENSIKKELRSDSSMCALMGVRTLIFAVNVRKWRLSRVDLKSAFLQTGAAERSANIVPAWQSADRFRCLWLLLTASDGLVNAKAKFQVQSGVLLLDLGLLRVSEAPQLFHEMIQGQPAVLVAKIVDDICITGEIDAGDLLLKAL